MKISLLISGIAVIFLLSNISEAADTNGQGFEYSGWQKKRVTTPKRTKKDKHDELYNCTDRVGKAMNLYNAGKYSACQTILDDAKVQCGGSSIMDTTLYYLGMSFLKSKKYVEARTEFERLVQDYPVSVYTDDAKFRIGQAVYLQSNSSSRDQTETSEAVRIFQDFLDANSQSKVADSVRIYLKRAQEKLAEKEFNNSRFYEKINEPEAAIVYYKAFIDEYPESDFRDQALLNMANLLLKLNRKSEAGEALNLLVQTGHDKQIVLKAGTLRNQIGKIAEDTLQE